MPEEEVDPSFFAEFEGRRVYFCCKKCLRRFEQDPRAYADQVAAGMPVSLQDDADEELAHEDSDEYDHETDHGVSPIAMLGRSHVVAVHFPIALLLLAALLEIGGLVRTSWRRDAVVHLLVVFGAIGKWIATTCVRPSLASADTP